MNGCYCSKGETFVFMHEDQNNDNGNWDGDNFLYVVKPYFRLKLMNAMYNFAKFLFNTFIIYFFLLHYLSRYNRYNLTYQVIIKSNFD